MWRGRTRGHPNVGILKLVIAIHPDPVGGILFIRSTAHCFVAKVGKCPTDWTAYVYPLSSYNFFRQYDHLGFSILCSFLANDKSFG